MPMEQKNQMIENYIYTIANQLNSKYNGIMDDSQIQRAITMFSNSSDEYEEIFSKINELAEKVVLDYVREKKARINPELVMKNHKEIYSKLEELTQRLNNYRVDYQLAGALCAYIKYGMESSRVHDDIDINLNEADMDKFQRVCMEMGLQFHDDRLTTSRVLKNGIPAGEHEVMATLEGTDFHIGAFCFERMEDGTVINKGYYRDENNQVCSRNNIISPLLANEIFGRERVDFRGNSLYITPPEYIYCLKNYTQKDKDKMDLQFMEDKIDRNKLFRINSLLRASSSVQYEKVIEDSFSKSEEKNNSNSISSEQKVKPKTLVRRLSNNSDGFVNTLILIGVVLLMVISVVIGYVLVK